MLQLPYEFEQEMHSLLGKDFTNFLAALEGEPKTAIRLNPRKLQKSPFKGSPVPWSQNGFVLDERPFFGQDPLFHAGAYYVQDASSQFLEYVVKSVCNLEKTKTVLDLCAAPGGKTTHLLSFLPQDTMLVANEVINSRVEVLREVTTKWGYPNVVVTNKDPKVFSLHPNFFDLVVVDAPCSGEGMFRKDPNAIKEWSVNVVDLCSNRQRRILSDVWAAVKPGGILIYSTCTFNPYENEHIVEWLQGEFDAEGISFALPKEWKLFETLAGNSTCVRCLPHRVSGEGFFIAAVRKPYGTGEKKPPIVKEGSVIKLQRNKEYAGYFEKNSCLSFGTWQKEVFAFPEARAEEVRAFGEKIIPVSVGTTIFEQKGKEQVMHANLALSAFLEKNAFLVHECEYEEALQFLRKEPMAFEGPERQYLITYQNIALGFAKKSGNGVNSLYPMDWRLRK